MEERGLGVANDMWPRSRSLRWASRAAGLAAALALGVFIGRGPLTPPPAPIEAPTPKRTWMMAVADYVHLYTPDSFEVGRETDRATLSNLLAEISDRVEVDLAPALEVDGLTLRDAQLLSLNGLPLAQLAYTTAEGEPVAFCVIYRVGKDADAAPLAFRNGKARNLNAVLWDVQPRGYLVIGDQTPDELSGYAEVFAARIG